MHKMKLLFQMSFNYPLAVISPLTVHSEWITAEILACIGNRLFKHGFKEWSRDVRPRIGIMYSFF